MPKEPDGTTYEHKPCPAHLADVDTFSETSDIMEHGLMEEIKETFEKYMTMDASASDKEICEVDSCDYQPEDGGRVFALITAQNIYCLGSDFHYYVKGKNGYWSHKPETTNPIIIDDPGNTIKDPATCDRSFYTNFVAAILSKKTEMFRMSESRIMIEKFRMLLNSEKR